jgi:hypothetical protein
MPERKLVSIQDLCPLGDVLSTVRFSENTERPVRRLDLPYNPCCARVRGVVGHW